MNPKLRIPHHRSEGKEAPLSPTDEILSPCSMKILRRHHRTYDRNPSKESQYDQYFQQPCDIPIILGSSSLNRRNILKRNGWIFSIVAPDIDEKAIRSPDPLELPLTIATAKASALIQRLTDNQEEKILITCDQIVLFKGNVREKPENEDTAYEYLSSYSNDKVSTVSAVVVTHLPSLRQTATVDVADVSFDHIPEEVVNRIIRKGDVYNSAGGFCIEDPDLKGFVLSVNGTTDSVMGLPMEATVRCINSVLSAEGKDEEEGDGDDDEGEEKPADKHKDHKK